MSDRSRAQSFTHFSQHAFARVSQRTKLTCEEIARILDEGVFIDVGSRPGFNKSHLLFYSVPDDTCFVAIRDTNTGTVVTILPLDYHANLAWKVDEENLSKARELMLQARDPENTAPKVSNTTVFVISAHFYDENSQQKTKVLFRVDAVKYQRDMKLLLSDKNLFSGLDEAARSKEINPRSIFGISLRLGNKGEPISIDYHKIRNADPSS